MKRQGDILIVKIKSLPNGLRIKEDGIILRGETTGHAHKISNGLVYTSPYGEVYIQAEEGAELSHEEHKTIYLEKENYKVIRQREYVSEEEEQYVQD